MHYTSRFTGEYQRLTATQRAAVRDQLPPVGELFPWMNLDAPDACGGERDGSRSHGTSASPDLVAQLVRHVDWFGAYSSDGARRTAARDQIAQARRDVVAHAYRDLDGAMIAIRCASAALDSKALATCRADVAKIAMISDVLAFQVRRGTEVSFARRDVGRVHGVVDAYDDAHAVFRSEHALTLVPLGSHTNLTRVAIETAERHRASIALDLGEPAPRIVREAPPAALSIAV